MVAGEAAAKVLVMIDDEAVKTKRLSSCVVRADLEKTLLDGGWSAVAMAVAMQRASLAKAPLAVLEAALALVQTQVTAAPARKVWMLTTGNQDHAGSWGLSRSARTEASLPLGCIDAPLMTSLQFGPALTEPEAALREGKSCVPRLATAPSSMDGLVRLHFHARGAIGNLYLEALPALPSVCEAEMQLRVRAVGLNFRDVLNVLGEYPGDPGPPGGDASGVVNDAPSSPHSAFGCAFAPLASVAIASVDFLANKPSNLTFEEVSTLPVVWSTTHTALQRAALRANRSIIVQAAAGGVGLKAVEYAQWLGASLVGTAGRPSKHALLQATGVNALCSSRDGLALTMGVTTLLAAARSHAVLNSLSLDFIASSFASLSEGGGFEEIGKRGIWASDRHVACVPSTSYCAIALDTDMVHNPAWMHATLTLLAARARVHALTSLPFESFDMEAHYELAFRSLQRGNNTGKVVVRIVGQALGSDGAHVVTGGTGGLGLLTGRWLAQRGARSLTLASRSGTLAEHTNVEWKAVQASGTSPSLVRCDTGEMAHLRRTIAPIEDLSGLWHAAGALADAVLPKQGASSLSRVYAPKMLGASGLHAAGAKSAMDAVALFSSVAALLGSAGQANYAAANVNLDALAALRRAHGITAASVQWGAWAEVGMASRGSASERVAAMEKASGFARIGLAQGLTALAAATRYSAPSVLGVVPGTWSRFLGADAPAFLSAFASKATKVGATLCESATAASGVSLEAVLELVKRTAGGPVDVDAPLMEAGVDSLGAVELRNQLQSAAVGLSLPSTLVFDHPTARQLASLLQPTQSTSVAASSLASHGSSALVSTGGGVGIHGMSALFPSGASSLHLAKCTVTCGRNAIVQVPASRWDVHAQPVLPEPMASRVRHTGFVRGAELVDSVAFAVSPVEAAAMDPCQRLALEFGYLSLCDASLDRAALSGSLTGVFLGFAVGEFGQVLRESPAGGSVYAATGSSASIASGRISYALGLHGPCVSYDTACSAALAAGHAGLRALQLAECPVGLVVGVTLMLAPGVGVSFAVAGMTSVRGRSHTFDEHADGYARGEACGGVTLRHGEDGRANFELCGSAVRQDGRSASLTAPSGQAQQGLIVAALHDGGVAVDALSLNEAHGTGTALGDPIEVGSLVGAVLSSREKPLAVGGVKANIGHSEPAAGMTGLLKLALGLECMEASPNAQLRALNPNLAGTLRSVPCALPVQLATPSAGECSGGVSSYGYSGTIVHTVLRSTDCARVVTDALISPPKVYRRRAFPWREAGTAVNAGQLGMYAACWVECSPKAEETVAPCACLMLSSRNSVSEDPHLNVACAWHVLGLLLGSDISSAPASQGILLLLSIAQQLATISGAPRVLAITGSDRVSGSIADSGVWGFARAVRLEHPPMSLTVQATSSGRALLKALASVSVEEDVTWRDGAQPFVARLRACAMGTVRDTAVARGTYAITGGLGGLGLQASKLLGKCGATHILLASRGGRIAPNERTSTGVGYAIIACDGGDVRETGMLTGIHSLSGILHASGILRDKMLLSMRSSELEAVFAPKACAASYAHEHTARTPLEALGFFSSHASTFGNVGQANYAAANAYLDGLASYRRLRGSLSSSLQIPAVSGGGMGAATFGAEQLDAMGAISLLEFTAFLHLSLGTVHPAIECTQTPLPRSLLESVTTPAMSELEFLRAATRANLATTTPVAASSVAGGNPLAEVLATLSPTERRTHIEAIALGVLRKLADTTSLSLETPIAEMGIDSLGSTEVVSQLRKETGLPLPPTLMMQHPTPALLVEYLVKQLTSKDAAADTSQGSDELMTSVSSGCASVLHSRLSLPIIFVLGTPRSGSSLLQLCLNAHPKLYAPQELYLLMFDTMAERTQTYGDSDFEEGLIAAVKELRAGTLDDAEATIASWGEACPISDVYGALQELCKPRILVDKTPPYCANLLVLQRAEEVFASARYLHLVRHPYAAIESGLQLGRDILGNLNVTWSSVEQSWFEMNLNCHNFLLDLPDAAKITLR